MRIRNPQTRRIWFGTAALFALSAGFAFVYHDAFGVVWLALAALSVGLASRNYAHEATCMSAGSHGLPTPPEANLPLP